MLLSFLENSIEDEEQMLGLETILNHDIVFLLTNHIPTFENIPNNDSILDEHELAMT